MTDDEVATITNNIIKVSDVKIVPVPFEAEGEAGLMYRATLKATIDTDGVYAWLKRDDKEKVTIVQQNNELQNAIQKNDKLDEDLKEQYKRTKSQAEKNKIREQMKEADRDFLANQKLEEGNTLAYAKDYNGAIKLYDEALKLNPDNAVIYNNYGLAYVKLKFFEFDIAEYERAIEYYNKAIELNPNNSDVYNNRGVAYYLLEKYQQAIADVTKAIQINPNHVTAYQLRGLCYQALGDNEKVQADLAKAKQLGWKG